MRKRDAEIRTKHLRDRGFAFALRRGLIRKSLVRLGTGSEIEFVHRDPSLAHLPHTDWGPKTLASAIQLPFDIQRVSTCFAQPLRIRFRSTDFARA